jgi:hypothetical protein
MKRIIILTLMIFGLISPVLLPATPTYAACPGGSRGEVLTGIGATDAECDTKGDSQVQKTLRTVVNLLGLIAGIVAVIMVILSGFKYITSGGDSSKVASAKSSLIYALVGVAIVALSQFLVHFVITAATKEPLSNDQRVEQAAELQAQADAAKAKADAAKAAADAANP